MNKKLIIGLAIGIPLLVGGIIFYRKKMVKPARKRVNKQNVVRSLQQGGFYQNQGQIAGDGIPEKSGLNTDLFVAGGNIKGDLNFSNLNGMSFIDAWNYCDKCFKGGIKGMGTNSPCLEKCLKSKGWTMSGDPYTPPKSSPKSTTLTNFY